MTRGHDTAVEDLPEEVVRGPLRERDALFSACHDRGSRSTLRRSRPAAASLVGRSRHPLVLQRGSLQFASHRRTVACGSTTRRGRAGRASGRRRHARSSEHSASLRCGRRRCIGTASRRRSSRSHRPISFHTPIHSRNQPKPTLTQPVWRPPDANGSYSCRAASTADDVEAAARTLNRIGLPWDAARLAGEAALRTPDTKSATALLHVARSLRTTSTAETNATDSTDSAAPPSVLTEREQEVAELVVVGLTYREIGERLYISAKTVEHHVARIKRRVGAQSRSELLTILRSMTPPNK